MRDRVYLERIFGQNRCRITRTEELGKMKGKIERKNLPPVSATKGVHIPTCVPEGSPSEK